MSEKRAVRHSPEFLHLDQIFAFQRRGNVHVLKVEPATEFVKYKGLHLWPPCFCLEPTWCSKQPGEESWAGGLPARDGDCHHYLDSRWNGHVHAFTYPPAASADT
jgi:hypothetical protein